MSPSDPITAASVPASRLQLAPGPWTCLLEGLCARFPQISMAQWQDRFARGRVQDAQGRALRPGQPWRVGLEVRYFREVAGEPAIPFEVDIVHQDADLLVADKPHFLPVVPAGPFVTQTVLARLVAATGNPDLVPLHRLDRLTAGLVLFSTRPQTRDVYQRLFRDRQIAKTYEALAPPLPRLAFPHVRRSRIETGSPFFRMTEAAGEPNSETRIEVLAGHGPVWRYGLQPVSGRKHQLRLHMAALGAPILGDDLYPTLATSQPGAPAQACAPLQLLARELTFSDPLHGTTRHFRSTRRLAVGSG